MNKKYNFETDTDTLKLISHSLDLYSRLGLGQFWYITDNLTVSENLNLDLEQKEEFERKAVELSNLYTGNKGYSNFGIFNKNVGNDCKIAAHLHQKIRHYLWTDSENQYNYTVDAYPADIAQIANIPEPNFDIRKECFIVKCSIENWDDSRLWIAGVWHTEKEANNQKVKLWEYHQKLIERKLEIMNRKDFGDMDTSIDGFVQGTQQYLTEEQKQTYKEYCHLLSNAYASGYFAIIIDKYSFGESDEVKNDFLE